MISAIQSPVSTVACSFEGTAPAQHPAEPVEVSAVILRPTGHGMDCGLAIGRRWRGWT
jgi:hypothetical protein